MFGQTATEGFRLRQPGGQRFRLEEVENFARTRHRIGAIGKADNLAGGLKQETQRDVVLTMLECGAGVALGLAFGDGEVFARAVFFASITPTETLSTKST